MEFGISLQALVAIHVALSLIGIATGVVALTALARARWQGAWQQAFLATTTATVVTGFMFPITQATPALVVGAISSVALAVAYCSLLRLDRGAWAGRSYVVSAMAALYLNLFVLVAQAFMQVPQLARLAPTQTEAPFAVAQVALLIGAVALGISAVAGVRRMRTLSV